MNEDLETPGTNRRNALKGMAAGAAGVWAAPAVLGAAQARAATSDMGLCDNCAKDDICAGFANCGDNNNGRCSCLFTVEGCTFCCDTDAICGNDVCTTSADCPDGWACITSCCSNDVCAPPCTNQPAPPPAAGQGARASL